MSRLATLCAWEGERFLLNNILVMWEIKKFPLSKVEV